MNTSDTEIFKNKDSREVVKLLTAVATSVLPNPQGQVVVVDRPALETVQQALRDIRHHLRVAPDDNSFSSLSKIYEYLSDQLTKVSMADVDQGSLKIRLGNRGTLHPRQYEVTFGKNIERVESLGGRKSHMAEAVTNPDTVLHITPKLLNDDDDPKATLSVKSVRTKRAEDEFLLLVISQRFGVRQQIQNAFRVYKTDVRLTGNDPIEVVTSFVDRYGVKFRLGDTTSRFLYREAVKMDRPVLQAVFDPTIYSERDHHSWVVFAGADTHLRGSEAEIIAEAVLMFVIDVDKYVATLRKHRVPLAPEIEKLFTETITF
jgi:hypothetical protein